jgi:hypothetical protein
MLGDIILAALLAICYAAVALGGALIIHHVPNIHWYEEVFMDGGLGIMLLGAAMVIG